MLPYKEKNDKHVHLDYYKGSWEFMFLNQINELKYEENTIVLKYFIYVT